MLRDETRTKRIVRSAKDTRCAPLGSMDPVFTSIRPTGRDHGLAPYNQYRSLCNLTYARDFNDLTREISPPILERLRRTYPTVNDIGTYESVSGTSTPIVTCIMPIVRATRQRYNATSTSVSGQRSSPMAPMTEYLNCLYSSRQGRRSCNSDL